MKHFKICLSVSALFFFQVFVYSQNTANPDFEYIEVKTERNNGSNAVKNLLCPSADDFLWYSTFQAIAKLYGNSTVINTIESPTNEGLSNYNDLFEDREGNVWVATNEGLYRFEPTTKKGFWLRWQNPKNRNYATIIDVNQTSEGKIIATTGDQYVLEYVPQENRLLSYRIPSEYYEISREGQISQDFELRIDEVLDDGGLIISQFNVFYLFKDARISLLADYKSLRLKGTKQYTFDVLDNGAFFKANSSGTYVYDGVEFKYDYIASVNKQFIQLPSQGFKVLPKSDKRNSSLELSKVNDANSKQMQFYKLDDKRKELLLEERAITFDQVITDIAFVTSEKFYVSTAKNIYAVRSRATPFQSFLTDYQFNNNSQRVSTRGFAEDALGNIYVGSYSGIYKLDTNRENISKYTLEFIENNGIAPVFYRQMYFDTPEDLWIGGETYVIVNANVKNNTFKQYSILDVRNDRRLQITCMKPWGEHKFLVGTTRGLFTFDKRSRQFTDESRLNEKNNLHTQPINNFYIESDRKIWVLTDNAGVFIKDFVSDEVDQITFENTQGGLGSNSVYDMHKRANGDIFFGTFKGLSVLYASTGNIENYTRLKDGISNDVVIAFSEDEEGLWFSTYNGLTYFHYEDDWFYNYYAKDGLPDDEFNKHSVFRDKQGNHFFGGLNGFVTFDPKEIKRVKPSSKIDIVSAEFFDKNENTIVDTRVRPDIDLSEVILPFEKNFFNINYAISDPFNNLKSSYEFKLDGRDSEWIDLGPNTNLRLNVIAPGKYTLKIRGTDGSGNPTINQLSIPIEVSQIFYKTWWFSGILLLLLVLGVSGYVQFRRYRWQEKYDNQRKVDQLEAKSLRAQMNPHFMFNALNGLQSVMILKGEREANKYLGSFSKLLRSSIDMSHSENITLKEELSYLTSYLNLEQLRQARVFKFSIETQENIDKNGILLPCMLFQPICENALIHGLSPKRDGVPTMLVSFKIENDQLVGTVTDNGIGRARAAEIKAQNRINHKSWATRIMKERIEIINKYTDQNVDFIIEDLYEDEQAIGTRVTLKLPLLYSK